MKAFIAVLLMAAVTYLPRVTPMAIVRKDIKSIYIRTFLDYVPYAVLAALTFPDIFNSTMSLYSAVVGTIIAIGLAYFERSLVVVATCAIGTVFVTEQLLTLF